MSETPQEWMEKFGTAENPEQALSYLDSALALDGDFIPAIGCKGTMLGQMSRHEEALACFERVVELVPDSGAAHYSVGLHLQSLGRNDEALAAYDKAIELAPEDADPYVNRGRLRDEGGDPKAAIEDYDRALAIKADDAIALSNRGNSLMAVERLEEALQSFDRAVAADDSNIAAKLGRCTALAGSRIDEANAARPRGLRARPRAGHGGQAHQQWRQDVGAALLPQVALQPEHLAKMAQELLEYCAGLEGQGPWADRRDPRGLHCGR